MKKNTERYVQAKRAVSKKSSEIELFKKEAIYSIKSISKIPLFFSLYFLLSIDSSGYKSGYDPPFTKCASSLGLHVQGKLTCPTQ